MRELPTLTSLLIYFTRSISPLLLAVLVTDCHFWRLTRVIAPMIVVKKTLASVTNGLLIMLHLTRSSLGVWQLSFSTYFEKSTSLSKPRTWSALSNTSMKSLIDEVLRAYKTVLLGKHIKIRLVALSEHTMFILFYTKTYSTQRLVFKVLERQHPTSWWTSEQTQQRHWCGPDYQFTTGLHTHVWTYSKWELLRELFLHELDDRFVWLAFTDWQHP